MDFDTSIFETIGNIVATIFAILFGLVAIAGGLLLHFKVFSEKNEGKYSGFMGWLYDFFNFKKLMIEPLLKLTYAIAAIHTTLSALLELTSFDGIIDCFTQLVFGNIALRIGYELVLLFVKNVRNTSDLNAKTEGEPSEFNKRFCDSVIPQYEKNAAPAPTAPAAPVATPAERAPAAVPTPVAAVPAPVESAPVYAVPTPVESVPAPVPVPVEAAPAPVELAKPVEPIAPAVEEAPVAAAIPVPVEAAPAPVELAKPVEPIVPAVEEAPVATAIPVPVEAAPAPVELAKPVEPIAPAVEEAPVAAEIPVPVEAVPVEEVPVAVAAPTEEAAHTANEIDEILASVPAPAPAETAPAKKVCPNCGKELAATAKFCGGCGTRQD